MNKTVLVCGSDGYIGHALTLRLLKKGYRVIGIDDFRRRFYVEHYMESFSALPIEEPNKRLEIMKEYGDFIFYKMGIDGIDDYYQLQRIFEEYKPDVVVNLAQQPAAPFSHKNRELAYETTYNNILGTLNILYAIKEYSPDTSLITIGCYDKETEILTEDGWKRFEKLSKNDKVMCLDKNKMKIEYHNPSEIQKYKYNGEMISIKNKKVDCLLTPNHRVVYKDEDGDIKIERADKMIHKQSFYIPKNTDDMTKNDAFVEKNHISKIEYNDYVYCCTVPTGIIMVRRNGKNYWSGNSMGEYDPSVGIRIPEGVFDFEYDGKLIKNSIYPRKPGSYYHACYSDDTEILTENGWKLFKNLNKKEKVATLNKEKNELEYQLPINRFEYDFDGDLISLKNKNIDLLVTDNHKLLEHSSHRSDLKNWRLTEAKNVYGKDICLKTNVDNWNGDDFEYFVLPECMVTLTKDVFKLEKEKYIPIEDWLLFFGWYITEGNSYKNSINISQKKEQYFEEIKNSLSIFNRKIQINKDFNGVNIFSIRHKQLSEYLKKFKLSDEKYIPKWIKNLSKPLLKILFDTMMKGDGWIDDKSKKLRGSYYTKSIQLANDFHEICLKLGYSAYLHKIDEQENGYCVYISDNKTTQINNKEDNSWNKINYNGKIYCVEVPNNIIYVRRNGKSVWCGNSKVASTYYIDCACRFYSIRATDIMQGVVYGAWTPEIEETGLNTRFDSDECFGTVFNRFIVQAAIGHPLTIFGKGEHSRGFLSLNDSVQCLMLAIENYPNNGEYRTWNQLDEPLSMNELADKVIYIANKFGIKAEKIHIESPRSESTDDFYYNPVVDKLKKLGFKPTRTIEDEGCYVIDKLKNLKNIDLKKLNNVVIPKITWKK